MELSVSIVPTQLVSCRLFSNGVKNVNLLYEIPRRTSQEGEQLELSVDIDDGGERDSAA